MMAPEARDACDVVAAGGDLSETDFSAPPPPKQPFVWASKITPKPVRWLWSRRIPRGKLTVLYGPAGTSKSTVSLDIAARVSTGRGMFDDTIRSPAQGNVLILSSEDDEDDTIVPRLDLAGADLSRVAVWRDDNVPTLPDHADVLRSVIDDAGFVLVVLDPVSVLVGAKTDTHKDAEVRRALAPLRSIGRDTGCTFLGISHLSKTGGTGTGSALLRLIGSVAWGAVVRSAVLCTTDPDDEDGFVLAVVKVSNARNPPSLRGRRVAVDDMSPVRVEWVGSCDDTADDLLSPVQKGKQSEEAEALLRRLLASGPMWVSEITLAAVKEGISWTTIKRAKKPAGAESRKVGGGAWYWRLEGDEREITTCDD